MSKSSNVHILIYIVFLMSTLLPHPTFIIVIPKLNIKINIFNQRKTVVYV